MSDLRIQTSVAPVGPNEDLVGFLKLCCGYVEFLIGWCAQTVSRIGNDADDNAGRHDVRIGQSRRYFGADSRAGASEESPCQRSAHDCHRLRVRPITVVEIAPAQQRNTECPKETRSDRVPVDIVMKAGNRRNRGPNIEVAEKRVD